jgi:thiamine biosynthesis lipoprotein
VRLPPGARLDLGGVAKGWAADRAARRLGATGPALVDASGDIAASAPPRGAPGWAIGVADPGDPGGQLALLCLARGGVATSGRDYRRWRRAGRWWHHLIDPRTGLPAETDVVSATVVAPTALDAEVAAKVALLLGQRVGLAWLEARPWLAGLLVGPDGRVATSRRWSRHLWR